MLLFVLHLWFLAGNTAATTLVSVLDICCVVTMSEAATCMFSSSPCERPGSGLSVNQKVEQLIRSPAGRRAGELEEVQGRVISS